MTEFDVAILGGLVFDGTRAPRYRADVGIRDGVITEIGHLQASDARRVLDASGMHVAPGFVDLHTHYDAQVFWDPYCTLSGWHGITSVAIGNCGFGFAPVRPDDRDKAMLSMTRVEAIPLASMQAGLPWDWVTFPEFLDSLDRTPKAMNLLPYVPIGPLLVWVMGRERAKTGEMPTDAEHAEMAHLLEEALDAGGCGWSAQRLHPKGIAGVQRDYDGTGMPTDMMNNKTALVLGEVLGRRNEGFIQTALASPAGVDVDREHLRELAAVSGRPILFNVVQAFDNMPEIHRSILEWLSDCHRDGLRIYGQGVTTDAGFTFTMDEFNLFDDAEPWAEATSGTVEERRAKLADPARREALKAWLPFAATAPIDTVTVLGPRTEATKPFENLSVSEVAERLGKHPVDAFLDIAVADDLKTLFFVNPPNRSREHLREVLADEAVLVGVSDGGAHTKFLTAGRYPTELLTRIVREEEILTLEQAHWRLSAFPAYCAGFVDRGRLQVGAPADVVVYDYEQLEVLPMEIAHDFPGGEWRRIQKARGYRHVLVNGEVTLEDDKETGTCSGRLLRHGRAS